MNKILIVDDSPELLELLALVFKARKFQTATASSVAETKKMLNTFAPDIILLDVMLDSEDGRELCREIKTQKDTCTIPIVLISASPKLLENYKEREADAVIEKPFDVKLLYQTVESFLPP